MVKKDGFPNPLSPGKFDLTQFHPEALYDSRWAGHPQVVKQILAGRYDLLTPIFSEFIPTLKCPYRCPVCHYRKPKEQAGAWNKNQPPKGIIEMSLDQAKTYLDKLAKGGCQAILLTGGGEPTMHPHLREIVEHIKRLNLHISMSTNGTFSGSDFKVEETLEYGFDNVRISLNTIEHHASFHGYDPQEKDWLEVVLANIARIAMAKLAKPFSPTKVTVCFIFNHQNYQEFATIGERLKVLQGIDWLVIRPVINYFGSKQVSQEILIKAAELIENQLKPQVSESKMQIFMPGYRMINLGGGNREYSQCRACGLIGGVWPDGRMFICTETNGKDEFCIGDLSKQTLKEIYTSAQYKTLREKVGREKFANCPVTCRPTNLNLVFEKLEQFRQANPDNLLQLTKWARQLQKQQVKPCPWIQA